MIKKNYAELSRGLVFTPGRVFVGEALFCLEFPRLK